MGTRISSPYSKNYRMAKYSVLTDTGGEPIKRVSKSVLRRILDNPVPMTEDDAQWVSLVFCEEHQVHIARYPDGYVFHCQGTEVEIPPELVDKVIRIILREIRQ
jgi:hypothetical protein